MNINTLKINIKYSFIYKFNWKLQIALCVIVHKSNKMSFSSQDALLACALAYSRKANSGGSEITGVIDLTCLIIINFLNNYISLSLLIYFLFTLNYRT